MLSEINNIELLAETLLRYAKKNRDYSAGYFFYCPEDGTILLLKRSNKMNNPNLWDIPGGRSSKKDKSTSDTAKRETLEELGELPKNKKFLTQYTIGKKSNSEYHLFIYLISLDEKKEWTPKIKLDKENSKFDWFNIFELPHPLRYDMSWVPKILADKGVIKLSFASRSEYTLPRFEHKYIVPTVTVPEIREFIKGYTKPDEHGQFYNIKNIYLDTNDLKYFSEHLSSPDRYKLRARSYGDSNDVSLEVKRKNNGHIIKSRHVIPKKEFVDLLNNGSNVSFIKLMALDNAKPVLVIDYSREAYNANDNSGARVTFDRDIKYKPTDSFDFNQAADKQIMPSSETVLELKYSGEMPEFMKKLVKKFKLTKQPMSKYVSSIADLLSKDIK